MAYKILVLKGDGIGPEVVGEALQVLKIIARRSAVDLEFKEGMIGGHAMDTAGTPLPDEVLKLAQDSDAILLGAVGGPKWDKPNAEQRPEQALLGLRKALGLFANIRPVKTVKELMAASPLKAEVISGVDVVIIRELTGGIYYGKPSEKRAAKDGREAVDTCFYTEAEITRVLKYGFELARERRQKLTSVDKANVLATSRLWREIATELSAQFKDVAFESQLVDSMAMHLIRRPKDFDVVVTENMFGDILTDEASGWPARWACCRRLRSARSSTARASAWDSTSRFTAARRISRAATRRIRSPQFCRQGCCSSIRLGCDRKPS